MSRMDMDKLSGRSHLHNLLVTKARYQNEYALLTDEIMFTAIDIDIADNTAPFIIEAKQLAQTVIENIRLKSKSV